jgi:hypothetical protein
MLSVLKSIESGIPGMEFRFFISFFRRVLCTMPMIPEGKNECLQVSLKKLPFDNDLKHVKRAKLYSLLWRGKASKNNVFQAQKSFVSLFQTRKY